MPDFSREARAGGPVAGIDEAGRGPWAGPVVAAAVIFERWPAASLARTIDDSKVLSRARREAVFAALTATARIGVGIADVEEIDRLNILQATLVAMRRALDALGPVLPIDVPEPDGVRGGVSPEGARLPVATAPAGEPSS